MAGDNSRMDPHVGFFERRGPPPSAESARPCTFGTYRCGYEAMTDAWMGLDHVFSVGLVRSTTARKRVGGTRAPLQLMSTHPVDMLVADLGHLRRPPRPTEDVTAAWRNAVEETRTPPDAVVESWLPQASSWNTRPVSKAATTAWRLLGYKTRCKMAKATDCHGPVHQTRLMVVRSKTPWAWAPTQEIPEGRPFTNLLTPPGLGTRTGLLK